MEKAKIAVTIFFALASVAIYLFARGKPWEIKVLKRLIFLSIVAKFGAAVAIYTFLSHLVTSSDASMYYLPQIRQFLDGQVPYRDFKTSYSILFHPFFAVPVLLWKSTGAIVVTMIALESLMLLFYLRRMEGHDPIRGCRVGLLYAYSPITWYWVALTGYNSIIIASFVMFSLLLAERGRHLLSGIAGALSFLVCKLLAVLAWPGLLFITRDGFWLRAPILAISLIFTVGLKLIGINSFWPVEYEYFQQTSGNLWFPVWVFLPAIKQSVLWQILPIASFFLVWTPLAVKYSRITRATPGPQFDAAVGFIGATNLLFMILSKKAYPFYLPMALIFVIHAVFTRREVKPRGIAALAFIGATTTLEPYLWSLIRYDTSPLAAHPGYTIALLTLDVVTVLSYLVLVFECLSAAYKGGAAHAAASEAPSQSAALEPSR